MKLLYLRKLDIESFRSITISAKQQQLLKLLNEPSLKMAVVVQMNVMLFGTYFEEFKVIIN